MKCICWYCTMKIKSMCYNYKPSTILQLNNITRIHVFTKKNAQMYDNEHYKADAMKLSLIHSNRMF